jgi:hypothetical protein
MRQEMEAARDWMKTLGASVRIHLHAHPAASQAWGVAVGDNIYMHPCVLQLEPETVSFVLRHELAHVLQQRTGRVRPNGSLGGMPANDDCFLEWEADCIALGLLPPEAAFGEGLLPQDVQQPVLQCAMQVAGRRIETRANLSSKAAIILDMIPNGAAWLKVIGTSRPLYSFNDEYEMLASIQAGLHGSPIVLLRRLGLSIHPEAFRPLDAEDIERLLHMETAESNNSVGMMRLKKTLAAHELWSENEFTIGDEFLKNVCVSAEPLFRTLSLADRIALFDLVNDSTSEVSLNQILQKEAANFAVAHAQNALEFVDFYRFFMVLASDRDASPSLASKRARFAETMMDSWISLLHNQLWCPTLVQPPAPEQMPRMIREWGVRGQRLGFPRLSAALAHVAQFADLHGATGAAAQSLIERHMDRLQSFWQERVPSSVKASQYGTDLFYFYDLPGATAKLRLDEEGNLTVSSYTPSMPPARTSSSSVPVPPKPGKA